MSPTRITLDSPDLVARRRSVARQAARQERRIVRHPRLAAPVVMAPVAPRIAQSVSQPAEEAAAFELPVVDVPETVLSRQIAHAPTKFKRPKAAKVPSNVVTKGLNHLANLPYALRHRTRRNKLIFNGLSLLCIFVGAFAIVQQGQHNNNVVAISQAKADEVVTTPGVAPSVDQPVPKPKPKPVVYAPNQPKRLKIGSIKVNAAMIQLNMGRDGAIDTPYDVSLVGWYNKSAHPGDAGAMIFDGHVGVPGQPGIFSKLKDLVPGEIVEVEQGDGAKFTYKVVLSRTYDQNSYDRDDLFKPISDKPGLNIITCDGTYY